MPEGTKSSERGAEIFYSELIHLITHRSSGTAFLPGAQKSVTTESFIPAHAQ